ncbi:low temperature requirement protein A [Catenulispora sp. NF23]|uniref:Low temperature requirement protein A n=1 Tax=Catenulispora pinistramenti TaxID=2705254 RepID=A0ABS5KMB1_9ACTN|nr:low temperature requirement protein A [Catenulispora pinistramenti]MBS2532108.1 low temperature requirement protein A [Catenulispora pinistramenti]MBS2547150.1 low temperature requirement protein A [Catenulispora pinistramenti]
MTPRDRDEQHRAATSLELFFDLCFVVAVSQASAQLAAALGHGEVKKAVFGYLMAFFAIWWAWMNFTWFASAFDTDDVLYRVTTLVQIAGVLIFAAGIPRLFDNHDLGMPILGYVVMRLAMVTQWLRAAHGCTGPLRTMALRYAGGIAAIQVGWVLMLLLPDSSHAYVMPLGVVAELSVPAFAERGASSPWHPHHIAERYGLFTLIVLGESVAAATVAFQSASDEHDAMSTLIPIAVGGILLCFTAWWVYFARSVHNHLRSNRQAFLWGYGHYAVFGSAAAIGGGLEVAVEHAVGQAHISAAAATACVTVPAAIYFFTVWFIHIRHTKHGASQWVLPVCSAAVLACTLFGESGVLAAGIVSAAALAVGLWLAARG